MEKNSLQLWTKNFTLITIGTVISMLGNAIAGFAMGLLVLDYTDSTFMYALYMVLYSTPKVIMPTLSGPFIDKFSRRKTIYTLDFLSAVLYGIFALFVISGIFNTFILIAGCVIIGSIDSIYQVAYDSFYPMLITEGNYTKAYSIQGTLESLTMLMVPVSAFLYNMIGIAPLFLINMVTFFIAAVMETRITIKEEYVKKEDEVFGLEQYKHDFIEGVQYLKTDRGLMTITVFFMIVMFAGSAYGTIALPFFKHNFTNGEYVYIFTMGWMVVGRMTGGLFHYKVRLPEKYKFAIALGVYISMAIIDGVVLFMPIVVMMVMCLMDGLLGVTSYNIRISATQGYVPDERKGRFNGIFQMATTFGSLFGQLLAGICTLFIQERLVVSIFMAINLLAAIFIMGGNRRYVAKIYNRYV